MKPLPWCAGVAALDQDAFGAALRALCSEIQPREPGLVELLHRREDQGDGAWWLYVAVVLEGGSEGSQLWTPRPALVRAIDELSVRWSGRVPVLRVFSPGEKELERYHRAPEGMAAPEPPKREAPRPAAPAPKPAAPEPQPEKPAAPPAQRSLFG